MLRYVIVCGSLQPSSQSLKVSRYLAAELKLLPQTAAADIMDLQAEPLALWDPSVWKSTSQWQQSWEPKRQQLSECDAVIIVTPEYAGMASASIKNFLLFPTDKEVGNKPTLLVAVSASFSGSYPITELRSSGYKNNKLCYLPEHLIIRHAGKVLNENSAANDTKSDQYLRERIAYTLNILAVYAENFKNIRKQAKLLFNEAYSYGM